MADILIRGMELPTECCECRFCDNDAMCTILGIDLLGDYGGFDNQWFLPDDWKCPDCPLIALPEGHGPLIDADKLMRHYAWWGECEQKDLFDSIVEQQNTIVPAEKEDTQ